MFKTWEVDGDTLQIGEYGSAGGWFVELPNASKDPYRLYEWSDGMNPVQVNTYPTLKAALAVASKLT